MHAAKRTAEAGHDARRTLPVTVRASMRGRRCWHVCHEQSCCCQTANKTLEVCHTIFDTNHHMQKLSAITQTLAGAALEQLRATQNRLHLAKNAAMRCQIEQLSVEYMFERVEGAHFDGKTLCRLVDID